MTNIMMRFYVTRSEAKEMLKKYSLDDDYWWIILDDYADATADVLNKFEISKNVKSYCVSKAFVEHMVTDHAYILLDEEFDKRLTDLVLLKLFDMMQEDLYFPEYLD